MGFGHSTRSEDTGEIEWKPSLIDPKTGQLNVDKLPTIQQFLNRLLALPVQYQNEVFNEFFSRMERRIENAKKDGSFDPGTQTFKAHEIKKVSDEVVYNHPESTAKTRIVAIDATDPVHFTHFKDIGALGSTPVERYVKNTTSGKVYALKEGPPRTLADGSIEQTFRRIPTHGSPDIHSRDDFTPDKYEDLQPDAAENAWEKEITESPKDKTRRENFVVGAFLPIWDRLNIPNPKIFRFQTKDGENLLGAHIPPKLVDGVRARLGAKIGEKKPGEVIRSIVEDGATHNLANGWKLKRVRVSGNPRIEVIGPNYQDIKNFTDHIGGFTERIQYETRFFMPTEGAGADEAMGKLLDESPIVAPTAEDHQQTEEPQQRSRSVAPETAEGEAPTEPPATPLQYYRFKPTTIFNDNRGLMVGKGAAGVPIWTDGRFMLKGGIPEAYRRPGEPSSISSTAVDTYMGKPLPSNQLEEIGVETVKSKKSSASDRLYLSNGQAINPNYLLAARKVYPQAKLYSSEVSDQKAPVFLGDPKTKEVLGVVMPIAVTEKPNWAQTAIDRLKALKLGKPGMTQMSLGAVQAWDAAVDAAILAVKAGRGLQKAVAIAKGRFHERYPGATKDEILRLERAVQGAIAKAEGARQGLKDWGTKLKEEMGGNPEWNDLTKSLAGVVARASESQLRIEKDKVEPIREAVPSRASREAINAWIEADGIADTLKKWATESAKNPKTLGNASRYERALNLTPAEKAVARGIIAEYADALVRGQKGGILGAGIQDFVNHLWNVQKNGNKFAKTHAPQLTQFFANALQRKFVSNFEGEQAGMVPITYDISEVLGHYLDSMAKVLNTRKFIKDLTTGKASDGQPLAMPAGAWSQSVDPETGEAGTIYIKPTGDTPPGYRSLDHPAMQRWKWLGKDANGNDVMMQGDLAVHPEAYAKVKNLLSESAIKDWYNSEGGAMMVIPKALMKTADYYNSTAKSTALGFMSPFHQVQEGTHAVGHRVNPFQGLEPIEPWKNKRQRYAMEHGLMLGAGMKGRAQFMEGVGGGPNPLYKLPVFGEQAENYTTWLFNHYIPALKFQTWENMMKRNTDLYGKTKSQDEIAYLSAIQANSAYGHLNYAVMGRNPTIQHIARLFMLSPDFTEARMRFVGQAAQGAAGLAAMAATGGRKGKEAYKAGHEQFHALLLLAMGFYVGARIGNALLNDGDMHMEDPFRVHYKNRAYGMRSVPEDVYRMFKDWRMYTSNRMSPILRFAFEGMGKHNARGEEIDWSDAFKDLLTRAIPSSVSWVPGINDLSEYGKMHTLDALEQMAGIFGLQIQRISTNSEAHKLGNDFKKSKGIKGSTGSYPVSQYQQLRYSLEDRDMERAKNYTEKLIKAEIASHPDLDRDQALKKVALGLREALAHPYTQNEEMDEEFLGSLKGKQLEAVTKAEEMKQASLDRFTDANGLPYMELHPRKK